MTSQSQNARKATRGPARGPDPRAIATRKALGRAFATLSASGTKAPSVASLTDEAGVNRSSFYAHFATTDDVALFVLDECLSLLADRDVYRRLDGMPGREASAQVLNELITALLESWSELSAVFTSAASAAARVRFADLLVAGTRSFFDRLDVDAGDDLKSAAAVFVGNGVAAVLIDWLLDSHSRPRDEIVSLLVDLNPSWVINPQKRSVTPQTDIEKEEKK